MKVFYVPIEPYEIRYTEQWGRWFPDAFNTLGITYSIIKGTDTKRSLENGAVLDPIGTGIYKTSQLKRLIELIKDGAINDSDIILFADGWFPGVEAIQYIRQLTNKKFKVAAYFHAGSYDPWDFLALANTESWAEHLENVFFDIFDYIFVASEFHKQLISNTRKVNFNKIHVVGLPLDVSEIKRRGSACEKEDIVVFPHRYVVEKSPKDFEYLTELVHEKCPDIKFMIPINMSISKDEYYHLLRKSKVIYSNALQETFGIGTAESVILGCLPIIPNRLSYSELYPDFVIADASPNSDVVDLIIKYVKDYFQYQGLLRNAQDKIIEHCDHLIVIGKIISVLMS